MLNKPEKIWVDGKLVNWDDAKMHVLTHTLHYWLGAFEGIRCYKAEKGLCLDEKIMYIPEVAQCSHGRE